MGRTEDIQKLFNTQVDVIQGLAHIIKEMMEDDTGMSLKYSDRVEKVAEKWILAVEDFKEKHM